MGFHGLNAVASQLGPNNMLSFTYELIRDGLEKTVKTLKGPDNLVTTILLFAASFAAWTLFATDGYNGIDPWYTTLISATTIGYGDQGPQTADHKWMSAFILPLLTTAFAGWSNPTVTEKSVPLHDRLGQAEEKSFSRYRQLRSRRQHVRGQ